MIKQIQTWNDRRRAVAELSRLSDRALADVGIVRSDIVSVVTAAAAPKQPDAREMAFPLAGHRHAPAWA